MKLEISIGDSMQEIIDQTKKIIEQADTVRKLAIEIKERQVLLVKYDKWEDGR